MTRDELEQAIRARLNGDHEPEPITDDICEECASVVEEDPYTKTIPEHGGDTEHRVVWCDESCYTSWVQI